MSSLDKVCFFGEALLWRKKPKKGIIPPEKQVVFRRYNSLDYCTIRQLFSKLKKSRVHYSHDFKNRLKNVFNEM
jgi:hypothetical protein